MCTGVYDNVQGEFFPPAVWVLGTEFRQKRFDRKCLYPLSCLASPIYSVEPKPLET